MQERVPRANCIMFEPEKAQFKRSDQKLLRKDDQPSRNVVGRYVTVEDMSKTKEIKLETKKNNSNQLKEHWKEREQN